LPDGGYALSGLRECSRWNGVGRISVYAPSGIIFAAQLPDGGCALSGLPKRAYSHTDIAFTSGLAAAVLTPAEIGEPKRE